MESFKGLSIVLIVLSAFAGVINSLLPSKRNQNILKVIIVCVIIISGAACISDIELSDFMISSDIKSETAEEAERIKDKIDLSVSDSIAEKTEEYILSKLEEKEVFAESVTVITDRTEEESIYIKEIRIILNQDQKYLKEAVKILISEYADKETIVTVG